MNKAILMGRLTKDPTVATYQGKDGESKTARFTVAVDRKTKDNAADFIPCVAFGKNAEFVEKYMTKGMKVVVEGHIQTGSYKNKDGQTVYTTDIIVERTEFAESKKTSAPGNEDGFMAVNDNLADDGLPFN